ncbi:DUF421 domain-containing protein [Flavobacterium sp.]|uniref:DUF421 domain-containing protein n=1 Tax=Flavobacterium sp. TaxID=239 RepID=UPI00374DF4A8
MDKEDIKITDWTRIFLGEVPPEFIFEVIFRMFIIYAILVFSLRLLGRRMESMLSRGEMVTLVTLGASVGVAIHTPERGLLPSILVIIIIISLQLLQAYLTSRSSKAEKILLDEISTLVEDKRMIIPEMKKSRITRERLFAALRQKGIINLGTVQRVYFEAKGVFSIVLYNNKEEPGLCILPATDEDFRKEIDFDNHIKACLSCGNTAKNENTESGKCDFCGENKWEMAVKPKS